jgi:Gene product 88
MRRQRRFANAKHHAKREIWALADDHPAVLEARPVFPKTVPASLSPRLFVSGYNSRKLGGKVTKGEWAGMPIYQLTLPERTTCPRHCHVWNSCYGNAMPFARRHEPGAQLEDYIPNEILDLGRRHPAGFVVRLHVLGDFYSVGYVSMWFRLMRECPQLHIFGYTARDEEHDYDIFTRIMVLNEVWPDRCAIRYSRTKPGRMHAVVISPDGVAASAGRAHLAGRKDVILCPAQTEKTQACSTCGLCWSPAAKDRTIAFIEHGPVRARG